LTSILDEGEWPGPRPGRFTPGETALDTHWIEGEINLRFHLDAMEERKMLPLLGDPYGRNILIALADWNSLI
jgi:hypothetical protein